MEKLKPGINQKIKNMKNKLFFGFLIVLLTFTSCKSKKDINPMEEKNKFQSELIQSYLSADSMRKIGVVDVPVIEKFVSNAKIFAAKYPEESIAPKYLLEAGVFMMVVAKESNTKEDKIKHAQIAIEIFNNIQKIYPEYEEVRKCILSRGTTYDDILQDYRSAEIEYRDYIHKYPQDSLSQRLKEYVNDGLGKSPEEIFQEIQKKNKSGKK
jgi:hypothetical protein